MRLGYNTNGLQNHRLDEALRMLADRGYRAVALTPDVQHLDPMRCTSREVDAIAGLLARLDLMPAIETGARFVLEPRHKHEPSLMTRDPAARSRRLEFYRRCAEIGRDLGAGVVSFWSGTESAPAPDTAAWLRDGVAQTCELIRASGLRPALEPEPGMVVATVQDYLALADDPAAGNPALCLDIGHLYVAREAEPASVIAAQAARLAQVHLEDMRWGVHEHLAPGDGDVDFSVVRAALETAGYDATVCFELSRSSHRAPDTVELCLTAWMAAGR